jgi:hypothetical protein
VGVVDEDAAHGFGAGGEEVAAAVPALPLLHVHQAQVGFVDQRGGLQRLAGVSCASFSAASWRRAS